MAPFIIAENDVEEAPHSTLWRHELDYHMVLIDKWSLLHVYSKILSNIYDEIGQMPHNTHTRTHTLCMYGYEAMYSISLCTMGYVCMVRGVLCMLKIPDKIRLASQGRKEKIWWEKLCMGQHDVPLYGSRASKHECIKCLLQFLSPSLTHSLSVCMWARAVLSLFLQIKMKLFGALHWTLANVSFKFCVYRACLYKQQQQKQQCE